MKLQDLKKIIKECIIELSEEGKLDFLAEKFIAVPSIVIENNPFQEPKNKKQNTNNAPTTMSPQAELVVHELSKNNPKMKGMFENMVKDTIENYSPEEQEEIKQEEAKTEMKKVETYFGSETVSKWAKMAFTK